MMLARLISWMMVVTLACRKDTQEVSSELSSLVNNYLHSFWIRTQRKNSARTLLDTINHSGSDYVTLLHAIEQARKDVFTNDTENERYMHRFGSSRYYQILNQVEEALISHWARDKKAITGFKAYLHHYESTLSHSKQCLINAIRHENQVHHRHFDNNTEFATFPGYIRAMKREVDMREEAYKKYQQLLLQGAVADDSELTNPLP